MIILLFSIDNILHIVPLSKAFEIIIYQYPSDNNNNNNKNPHNNYPHADIILQVKSASIEERK